MTRISRSKFLHVVLSIALAISFVNCQSTLAQNDGTAKVDAKSKSGTNDDSDSVFGLTKVWQIHIHLSEENWNKMQPTGGGFPPMGFGPPPAAGSPGAAPGRTSGGPAGNQPAPFRPGSFGFEFDYVSADIQIGEEILKNVGLRFKGNGTYMMSASTRKRPFKLDFNRYQEDQRFHGLQQLNLHNDIMDPTHLKSAVSYNVFRVANVAAPRTAFAEVRLTIDGVCDKEFLGLYSLVEEIDKAFLRRHYKSDKGLLLKPEGTQGLEYKGENWTDYAWYEPKGKPTDAQKNKLIEITRLITQPDEQQFRDRIESMLDIDQFSRFLAANTLLSNMDSFLTQVHNYYLYLPPDTEKFEFLPWDMDLSFGAFFFAGSIEQLQDLSITHPHVGQNRLIERLMSWEKFLTVYRAHVRKLVDQCFSTSGTTVKELATLNEDLKIPLAAEVRRIEAQAAGGFGFGPVGIGPPRAGGPGNGGPGNGGPGVGGPGFGPPGFGATAATIEQFIEAAGNPSLINWMESPRDLFQALPSVLEVLSKVSLADLEFLEH
ncbi:MAG: CotH kinase family protein [Pirellulales bacterium]